MPSGSDVGSSNKDKRFIPLRGARWFQVRARPELCAGPLGRLPSTPTPSSDRASHRNRELLARLTRRLGGALPRAYARRT